jgi:CheY-like chemotaxis protein
MNAREPAILVIGADGATRELLREWLAEAGWQVVEDAAAAPSSGEGKEGRGLALVLVDLAFPRLGRAEALQRVAHEHAGVPVLALSATFHASAEGSGQIARSLGVAGVLPKPIRREALMNAVRTLSRKPS